MPIERGARSRHADLRKQVVDEIDRRRRAKQSTAELDRTLLELVGDAVASVGLAAYGALTVDDDKPAPAEVHLAAMKRARAGGARGRREGREQRRPPLPCARGSCSSSSTTTRSSTFAAIEALDYAVAPTDAEGFALALGSIFYELRVRGAGELCGVRRDARAVAPMQAAVDPQDRPQPAGRRPAPPRRACARRRR